jgi:hypothetical protein
MNNFYRRWIASRRRRQVERELWDSGVCPKHLMDRNRIDMSGYELNRWGDCSKCKEEREEEAFTQRIAKIERLKKELSDAEEETKFWREKNGF